jgi:hypothetical protein
MSMSYQPGRDVFTSEAVSLQEKMLRLRQQIDEAQQYRRQLDNGHDESGASEAPAQGQGPGSSYWRVEKQIADLRIWELEARMTALLDSHGD